MMGIWMSYMAEAAIIMTILYLVYKLLLSGLSFHSFNRKIILGIYIISWVLPVFTRLFTYSSTPISLSQIGNLEIIAVTANEVEPVKKFDWTSILVIVYLSGVLMLTATTLLSIWKMVATIRSARLMDSADYTVKVSDKVQGAFSWGKYIIIRPSDIDDSLGMVIRHEATHLRKRHWIDLIPARITIILQWFSPVAWLLARELHEVHEYEVDEIAAGDSIYEYQLMLIKKTAGARFPVFADSLNHSQIKKRLTMMRKKSNPKRRVAAMLLPFSACAAVLLISQPVIANAIDRLSSAEFPIFADNKINENDQNLQIVDAGGEQTVEKSPSLSVHPVQSSQDASSGDETLQDMLVSVARSDDSTDDSSADITPIDDEEKMAQFKGGEMALLTFLIENMKYPESEMNSPEPSVRVIVSFNILTDGSVDDIEVRKSGGEAFDAEAVAVVKKTSGRWEPAEKDGKPVVSQFTIPITFKKKA